MGLADFLRYSNALVASAESNSDVLGLVFVGSTADTSRVDQWSDHDFFWVVRNGLGEKYRQDLSWVPEIEKAILTPRETAHGLKVVFDNGKVLEFAVFEDSELELASLNSYNVPVDKTNLSERCREIAERSAIKQEFDWDKEFELMITLILLGVGRFQRGEILIAGQFIRSYVLDKLIGLIRESLRPIPGSENVEDNLNKFRRFEQQYPELGKQIESLLQKDIAEGAQGLLDIAVSLKPLSERALRQVEVVRDSLGWDA